MKPRNWDSRMRGVKNLKTGQSAMLRKREKRRKVAVAIGIPGGNTFSQLSLDTCATAHD